jgi:hypothetical protein
MRFDIDLCVSNAFGDADLLACLRAAIAFQEKEKPIVGLGPLSMDISHRHVSRQALAHGNLRAVCCDRHAAAEVVGLRRRVASQIDRAVMQDFISILEELRSKSDGNNEITHFPRDLPWK